MPPLQLPNELLETIFDHIHDKTDRPTLESQKTFASLARTSKLFLPLARSYLYYRPISPSSAVSWTKAVSLVTSLSSPLGRLVVSLEGIADFAFDLETLDKPVGDLPFKLSGYSPVFSFYYTITQRSLYLVTVEIIAISMRHLNKYLKALGGKESTLKTVKLGSTSRDWYGISFVQVVAALRSAQLENVENLVLEDVDTIDCLETLSRFNSLVTLSLHDFHGPSLDLVESLATSAPLLSRVDFTGCRWTRNSARLTTRSKVAIIVDLNASSSATTSGIVDLDDLKAVLLKMRKLKKIHLGLLPTEERETYESLGELRETNGIKVEWDNWES
ncbi:hypothetical protein JCM5350_005532 [Sporobolomyces pararoseus]